LAAAAFAAKGVANNKAVKANVSETAQRMENL